MEANVRSGRSAGSNRKTRKFANDHLLSLNNFPFVNFAFTHYFSFWSFVFHLIVCFCLLAFNSLVCVFLYYCLLNCFCPLICFFFASLLLLATLSFLTALFFSWHSWRVQLTKQRKNTGQIKSMQEVKK